MRRLLIAAAALTGCAGFANAADMNGAYDWSGVYIGLNAGAAFNNTEVDNSFDVTGQISSVLLLDKIDAAIPKLNDKLTSDETVFTGGAVAGYNWQQESFVLGLEMDINYLGFGDENTTDLSSTLNTALGAPNLVASKKLSFDADWYGTIRGRLGFAADNILFYGTGGLAYGHMEAEATVSGKNGAESAQYSASTDDVNWGWTIGAGVEYGIENWSLGVEYLFVDLGSADWDNGFSRSAIANQDIKDALDNTSGEGSADFQFSVVRATAKLRF